jgi:hypothetical protein
MLSFQARSRHQLLVLFVIAGVAGCGESSSDVTVQGKVAYRSQPLSKGSVTFFPVSGRPASTALADDGQYTLKLAPGQYTVIVNVGTDLPPGFKDGDPIPPPTGALPPEYTTRARSTLKATIPQSDPGPIDFELQ